MEKRFIQWNSSKVELENMIKDINPETIIDYGSNKGQFIMLIEQLFPHKIIYSFEPLVEALEIIKLNHELKF